MERLNDVVEVKDVKRKEREHDSKKSEQQQSDNKKKAKSALKTGENKDMVNDVISISSLSSEQSPLSTDSESLTSDTAALYAHAESNEVGFQKFLMDRNLTEKDAMESKGIHQGNWMDRLSLGVYPSKTGSTPTTTAAARSLCTTAISAAPAVKKDDYETMFKMLGLKSTSSTSALDQDDGTVKLVVKLVECDLPEHTQHIMITSGPTFYIKEILDGRAPLCKGQCETIAVPSKFIYKENVIKGLKAKSSMNGPSTMEFRVPAALDLSNNKGFYVGWSADRAACDKTIVQLRKYCETMQIPADALYQAGNKVNVVAQNYKLTSLMDVMSMNIILDLLM